MTEPMHPWTHYALTALHHGLIVAATLLLACAIVRAVQIWIGRHLDLEFALPQPRYPLWGAYGLGIGVAGAVLHWILFGPSHSALDALVLAAMGMATVKVARRSLAPEHLSPHWLPLTVVGVGPLGLLFVPEVWHRPTMVDWLATYEFVFAIGAALLIAFPVPALPPDSRPPRRRRADEDAPRPRGPKRAPQEPREIEFEPEEISYGGED